MKKLGNVLIVVILVWGTAWGAGAGDEAMIAGVDLENFTPHRTVHVSSIEELLVAVADARAGDLIAVADGNYDNTEVIRVDNKAGTAQAPIVSRAVNRGKARIVGRGGFRLTQCAYVAIVGFSLVHKDVDLGFRIDHSNHCRLTRNHSVSVKWLRPSRTTGDSIGLASVATIATTTESITISSRRNATVG